MRYHIGATFVHYYRARLDKEMPCEPISHSVLDMGLKVSIEAMEDLCKQVTREKIRRVIFKMGNDKAPRPDGYSALFFKKA
jgi:hypothetical protein